MNLRLVLLYLPFSLINCTSNIRPPIPLDARPQKAPTQTSSPTKLERLREVIHDDPVAMKEVDDVLAILQAQVFETSGKKSEATTEWFTAMRLARGHFGKTAFEAWVHSYTRELGEELNFKILAKLLLKETDDGSKIPYMKTNDLTTVEALADVLETILKPKLAYEEPRDTKGDADTVLAAPVKAGPPEKDTLLSKISASYCKAHWPENYQWTAWINTLHPQIRVYWKALIYECQGENQKAIDTFNEAIPKLAESTELLPYAIASCERLIKIQTRSALRIDVAGTFQRLVELWESKALDAQLMGLPESEFQFQRIDDYLSAARAVALAGDYLRAKVLAQTALDFIAKAPAAISSVSRDDFEALTDFKAEAYHLEANRIALESKEYSHASSIARIALQTPNLSQEWIERFLWTQGIYEFLDGKTTAARGIWETLLEKNPEQNMRPRIYYWIARTFNIEGQSKKRDQYLTRLMKEFPINFYAFIGSALSPASEFSSLSDLIGNPETLLKKISEEKNYNLARLRNHSTIGPLLLRTEILATAELYDWAETAGLELSKALKSEFPAAKHKEEYLYVSRLLYAAHDYKASILLTTALADSEPNLFVKWPEQILIAYPQPFSDIFQRKAQETNVDIALLYAIGRQESLFDKNAHSSAGALGVMQLILATARAMAMDAGLDSPDLVEKLLQPELNIELGSRYLKKLNLYFKSDQTAVIAGYNAGEFAVDKWLEHRPHEEQGIWLELIPFQQTRQYVEAVLRNYYIYKYLRPGLGTVVIKRSMDYKDRAQVFLPKERG